MSDVRRISIREFRERGYLQELNRQFLHPLGLALEVIVEEDGQERLGGVWDYRHEAEGMRYHKVDEAKARSVDSEMRERRGPREAAIGYWVQPIAGDS